MIHLKLFLFATIFALMTSVSVMCLDTTTCNTSGWFFPGTCSPAQCQMVSNPACNVTETINMIDIKQSISSMTCNSKISQSTHPMCKNASLVQLFSKGMEGKGIIAVYCTDKFLIIFTNDEPNHPLNIWAIPHPPAGGNAGTNAGQNTGGYTGCVTRKNTMQYNIFKIPLYPVDLGVSSLNNNNQIGTVDMFEQNPATYKTPILGTKPLQYYPIPAEGTVGVTITGIGFKVPYSQNGYQSWEECSLDNCNGHVPIGFGYHYHGDPFNCMYNQSDYPLVTSHPPVIGFGLDGFLIYGRYLDIQAPGALIPLDICGGHSHAPYGFHYHAEVKKINATDYNQQIPYGSSYYIFLPGITNCWRGNISAIPGFWNGISGSKQLFLRADYPYFQPPCSLTDWYANPSVKLNITALQSTISSTTSTTTPTTTKTTTKTTTATTPATTTTTTTPTTTKSTTKTTTTTTSTTTTKAKTTTTTPTTTKATTTTTTSTTTKATTKATTTTTSTITTKTTTTTTTPTTTKATTTTTTPTTTKATTKATTTTTSTTTKTIKPKR